MRRLFQRKWKANIALTTLSMLIAFFVVLKVDMARAVIIDFVPVGNAGNAGDAHPQGTFGAVSYDYRIGKYEVTNNQYAEFLNAIGANDPNAVWNSYMDITRSGSSGSYTYTVVAGFAFNPVNYVSFFNAMRFVNWLENGQPIGAQGSSTTEDGTYLIGDGLSETRANGATFFLPSEDEWYKAAYHKNDGVTGNYWDLPTQSDIPTIAEAPPGGANSANFDNVVGDTTAVGAYGGTTSPYGASDLGGNINEWLDAIEAEKRMARGGAFDSELTRLYWDEPFSSDLTQPIEAMSDLGFRVAANALPEPSSYAMAGLGLVALLFIGWRRRVRQRASVTATLEANEGHLARRGGGNLSVFRPSASLRR